MKKLIFLFLFLLTSNFVISQIPQWYVKDTLGNEYYLPDLVEDRNKNLLITLWATWCAPCTRELNAWKNYAPDWIDNYDVEIFAVSVDRTSSHDDAIKKWNDNDWVGELYFGNSSWSNWGIPQSKLFDYSGALIHEELGFSEGDEIKLDSIIKNIPPPPPPPPAPQPILTPISSDTIQCGTILENAHFYKHWSFMNSGKATLEIENVISSSGRCLPEWRNQPTLPEDTTHINFKYFAYDLGEFLVNVKIETNEKDSTGIGKVHEVWLKGNIIEPTTNVEEKSNSTFKVFPTITSSFILIESNTNLSEVSSYSIFDCSGKTISQSPIEKPVTQISVSNLKPGNYFVRIESQEKIIVTRFFKI